MTWIDRRFLIKVLLLLGLIASGLFVFIHHDLYADFLHKEKAIAFIKSFHPYDELVFISLQILQVIVAPIPGELTGIIGGYLYGSFFGTIYSTIGLTLGSWLAFALARMFGLPLVEKTVKPEIIQKYDYVMKHQGILVSFFLFLVPGFPKDYICYLMGLSHMRIWTFLTVSTIGRLFGTTLLSVSGSNARNNQYGTLLLIIVLSGVLILIGYLYRKNLVELLKKIKTRR
ncbi:MAG: TVP38/TMEM64 family protein [Thermodesulfobacteriota bacterium]|jgi:uncharacterized membrane protein YdjX (TVP38/TMEM64 family)|nr:MAG: TVP38/TMEM64 family protein [Thermodesulfobacteriota bacterium]